MNISAFIRHYLSRNQKLFSVHHVPQRQVDPQPVRAAAEGSGHGERQSGDYRVLWQTMQEDLSWPPWIQHTTHLSNLLLVVSTATSFYIYLLKHHARTETELPRPQHLYLAGHHQHSYRVAAVCLAELQTKFREGSPLQGPSPGSKHQIEHSHLKIY